MKNMEGLKKSSLKGDESGFTLIELIVVMIIIAILVLLAAPRFMDYIETAKQTRMINDVKILETESLAYEYLHDGSDIRDTDLDETTIGEKIGKKLVFNREGVVTGTSTQSSPGNNPIDLETNYKNVKADWIDKNIKSKLDNTNFYLNKDNRGIYIIKEK